MKKPRSTATARISNPATGERSLIRRFKKSDGWLWMELFGGALALLFLGPTAWMMWIDHEDRKAERIARADSRIAATWGLVTREATGNAGKGPALEYLHSQGEELIGIDLRESYLRKVVLPGANLWKVDMRGATLSKADLREANFLNARLRGAVLFEADLSGAKLGGADLRAARLRCANLSNAILRRADLSGAYLAEVDLSGADLERADLSGTRFTVEDREGSVPLPECVSFASVVAAGKTVVEQRQLDRACGDEHTVLESPLTVPPCAEADWYVPEHRPRQLTD